MAKILITGGAGYIGSHTALELLKEGYEVVVYDNLCNSSRESLKRVEELTGKSITFYEGDVMDAEALKAMFEAEKIDAVIHCAALQIPFPHIHQNHVPPDSHCNSIPRGCQCFPFYICGYAPVPDNLYFSRQNCRTGQSVRAS